MARCRPVAAAHKLMGMARGYLEKYPAFNHGLVLPEVIRLIDHWRRQVNRPIFKQTLWVPSPLRI